ncbi:ribosomal protein L1-like protein [Cantharellus anzutake]|uniref:ribosomal protein L1-like protein n=1 Tax=Cantharellus anzutake TaxID=1750568 RepID=UPI001905C071|nr:ribosomal protein L1-like protein [Cantharellus anzutake]KAF8320513.1 ribosomal protein L1-like protein [Cantharellus anzutake]
MQYLLRPSLPPTPRLSVILHSCRQCQPQRTFTLSTRLGKQSEAVKAEARSRRKLKASREEAMTIRDAAAILKAVEATSSTSAFELAVITHHTKGSAPPRSRIILPRDPRSKPEIMLVFAEGKQAASAKRLGAAYVGGAELIPDVLSGEINPTKVLSTPALLPTINPKLARFLGPKGLMPSTKRGTVTDNIALAVKASRGALDWKGDKQGVIRIPIARITDSIQDLEQNIRLFIKGVKEATADKNAILQNKKSELSLSAFSLGMAL